MAVFVCWLFWCLFVYLHVRIAFVIYKPICIPDCWILRDFCLYIQGVAETVHSFLPGCLVVTVMIYFDVVWTIGGMYRQWLVIDQMYSSGSGQVYTELTSREHAIWFRDLVCYESVHWSWTNWRVNISGQSSLWARFVWHIAVKPVCWNKIMPYGYSYKASCASVRGGTAAPAPPPFRPSDPALCGSRPLVTPYYCILGDLLCLFCVYPFVCTLLCMYCICVFSCFRCFLSLL